MTTLLCSCALCSGASQSVLGGYALGGAPDSISDNISVDGLGSVLSFASASASAVAPLASTLAFSLVQTVSPPAPTASVINQVISGDSRIDTLLEDPSFRLNSTSAVGTPTTVTYSFPSTLPYGYSGEDAYGWRPFSAQQQAAVRDVLKTLQQQIGVTFVEVADTRSTGGTIRFSDNYQSASSGYSYLANSSGTPLDSDVFISTRYSSSVTPGSFSWETLVHELGHALGLKHPGNYDALAGTSAAVAGNILGVNEDTFYNTIMSYRDSAQSLYSTSFMPYDMLTLRYLYGKRAFETSNNTYNFNDASGQQVRNIVDDGGTDTLDFTAVTLGVSVDLTPGAFSNVGKLASGAAALANLTISLDAVVENVVGTGQADFVLGNAANNTFTGGGENDTFNGAGGIDTAVYSGPRASYILSPIQYGVTVQDKRGFEGTDTLLDVERLRFTDTGLALDLTGHAGQTAKIIGAVFGSAALANKALVASGLGLLDGGMSYEALCAAALGSTGKTAPNDIVTLLWQNLTGFTPTPQQIAPYAQPLAAGANPGNLVLQVAESPLNSVNINLIGLIATGLEFA